MRWVRRRRQSLWLLITLTFLGLSLLRVWERFHSGQAPEPTPETAASTGHETGPFRSAPACRRGLFEARAPEGERVRVLSWNLRWFPYGVPPERVTSATADVDVEWLACIMLRHRASIVALQEVVGDTRGRAALARLAAALTQLGAQQSPSRGPFMTHVDPCPGPHQHLAFLVDASRHPDAKVRAVASINPTGEMCAGRLRPGLLLTLSQPPFSLLNVHLDSGRTARDARNREASLQRATTLERSTEGALVVLGDLNLMGCEGCGHATADAEARALIDRLALQPLDLSTAGTPGCTHYHDGRGVALDRALAVGAVPNGVHAEVIGPCAALGCGPVTATALAAMAELSDHCPLLLTLQAGPSE